MVHGTVLTMIIGVLALAAAALAGIPEPDAILYGTVTIDGVPVTAADDVTVIGRVDGVANPVGSYHMGDNAGAGDNYALRIRLESLADGSSQSDNAAIEGDTVRLFVQQSDGPELEADQAFVVSSRGEIQMLDITATTAPPCPWDSDDDGEVGAFDLAVLLGNWGDCPPECPWDFDGDGEVGAFDLAVLLGNWGACE